MRAEGYEWDHELRVALPVSYAEGTRAYPVLWVTDAMLETALSALGFFVGGVDLIVVSVGPEAVPMREFSRRRTYDFMPHADFYPPAPGGEQLRRELEGLFSEIPAWPGGGAATFLDFLVDEARPALAADYSMSPDDHGLFGYSMGGGFVGFALFARP